MLVLQGKGAALRKPNTRCMVGRSSSIIKSKARLHHHRWCWRFSAPSLKFVMRGLASTAQALLLAFQPRHQPPPLPPSLWQQRGGVHGWGRPIAMSSCLSSLFPPSSIAITRSRWSTLVARRPLVTRTMAAATAGGPEGDDHDVGGEESAAAAMEEEFGVSCVRACISVWSGEWPITNNYLPSSICM